MNKKEQKLLIKHIIAFTVILAVLIIVNMILNPKGDYKEGTYFGSSEGTTAVVYVNGNGNIKSVFIDAAYLEYNTDGTCTNSETKYGKTKCSSTTKQILGDAYGMKVASSIGSEWNEQVKSFANKVVEEQGTAWAIIKEDGKTDSISSVTITASQLVKATNSALSKAKK